jgi:protein-disulfide isomerase
MDTIKALLKDEPIETISASPKIVLVVFSDFECPFCTRFFQSTLAPTLTNTSSETALIYKQFPLSFHSHAYPWAVESECVAKNL